MTDAVLHPHRASGAPSRFRQFVALLERLLRRAITAHATHRALNDLPDNVLRDIGLTRSEIPFVADMIADAEADRDAFVRQVRSAVECGPAARFLPRVF
jgi:uncharacterized protein YjiS (DUF1127 family)